ncbi:MAG: NADH:ubiquinone reductase (Na(+)-transporting) subunit A [Myxococcales bacterium]|nr:NADH:ubiquinone reductase (Na(+)-transporting) subunit A [Myxococcales bacterium]
MAVHMIKQGLDLPITGKPADRVEEGPAVRRVAIVAADYPTMKPRMAVSEGDSVKCGQLLFEDRKSDGVRFTAPVQGTIVAINRGERRVLQTLVIELATAGEIGEQVDFESYTGGAIDSLSSENAVELLAESGLWTALRSRPYGRVPSVNDKAAAVFITAIDTHPLAGSIETALSGHEEAFKAGLDVVSKLTEGKTYLCTAKGSQIPSTGSVELAQFGGKHPAGLPGTHIHTLDPVSRKKAVWHLGWQDVIAIGTLFTTGKLDCTRVVALGGPVVKSPRMLRTLAGVSTDELTANELIVDREIRKISGSILGGRNSEGDVFGFLGRYHNQISCLAEDRERVFFGWLSPGFNKYSTVRAFAAGLMGMNKKPRALTTNTNGSHRAMVPIGMFERVMPLDILPTFLLRALCADDVERAEALGCLELTEDDLALCTFVSPGKEDFGRALRRNLDEMWKEG